MKYLIIVAFFLLGSVALSAQEKHFVFIQSDNNQAFYVQMNGKLYSSSGTGYMILSKLVKGTYTFIVGFPQNAFPEQSFECAIDTKDLGFNLKNFGDKGWGLFNLQTYEVVKATPANTNEAPKIVIEETPKVVEGEPVISFNTKPKETPKPIVKQPNVVANTEVLNTETITTPTIFKANIKDPNVKAAKINKPIPAKPVVVKTVVANAVDTILAASKPIETVQVVEAVSYAKETIKEDGTFLIYIAEPDIKIRKKAIVVVPNETVVATPPVNTIPLKAEDVLKIDVTKPEVKAIETSVEKTIVKDAVVINNAKSDVKKVNETKNEEGLSMTFVDEKGQIKDTIQAVIPIAKMDTPVAKTNDSIVANEKPELKNENVVAKTENVIVKPVDRPLVKTEVAKVKTEEKETKEASIDTLIKKEPIMAVTQPPVSTTPPPVVVVEFKPVIVVKDTLVPQSVAYDSPLNDKNISNNVSSNEPVKPSTPLLIANRCTALAFEEDYYRLRKKMLSQMSDEKMITEARKVYVTKCFTTAQVKALSVLFMSDEGRYKFFDASYSYVIDPEKFPALQSELIDAYYLGRFKAMLR